MQIILCCVDLLAKAQHHLKDCGYIPSFIASNGKDCITFEPLHKYKLLYVIMKHMDVADGSVGNFSPL